MKTTELFLVSIILIIPTLLAFIASILYVKRKNTIISKFLLLGSFFILATLTFVFYIVPTLTRSGYSYSNEFLILAVVSGSIGYISFFITFFFHIQKILKEDKLKNDKDELNNIGIR